LVYDEEHTYLGALFCSVAGFYGQGKNLAINWSIIIATTGEKSHMPKRGMMRRKGDRIGSVMRIKMTVGRLAGNGETQDRRALMKMAAVST